MPGRETMQTVGIKHGVSAVKSELSRIGSMPLTEIAEKGLRTVTHLAPFLLKKHPVIRNIMIAVDIAADMIDLWKRKK